MVMNFTRHLPDIRLTLASAQITNGLQVGHSWIVDGPWLPEG